MILRPSKRSRSRAPRHLDKGWKAPRPRLAIADAHDAFAVLGPDYEATFHQRRNDDDGLGASEDVVWNRLRERDRREDDDPT